MKFKEWPILAKIVTISLISVSFVTVMVLLYFMPLIEARMMEGKKEGIKNVIDVAYSLLNEYDKLAAEGEFPLEQAKVRALQRIRAMRYLNETMEMVAAGVLRRGRGHWPDSVRSGPFQAGQ